MNPKMIVLLALILALLFDVAIVVTAAVWGFPTAFGATVIGLGVLTAGAAAGC